MKTITLEIRDEDVYQVIVDELKDVYQRNCSDTVLEPEYELRKAICVVLAYYMRHDDYEKWIETTSGIEVVR